MADGVAPDKLYPLDVDRGFKKLDSIKAQTIFWSTNSQAQQLFVDGEVNLGLILNGRAYDARRRGRRSRCPGSRTSNPWTTWWCRGAAATATRRCG